MKFTLPLPPSVNRIYKIGNSRIYTSKELAYFKEAVFYVLRGKNQFSGKVSIYVDFYFPNDRHDIDNCLKPLFDSLQGTVIKNDRQIRRAVVHYYIDKRDPRVEVELTALAFNG